MHYLVTCWALSVAAGLICGVEGLIIIISFPDEQNSGEGMAPRAALPCSTSDTADKN